MTEKPFDPPGVFEIPLKTQDIQAITDAWVYLIGRAIVIRQEQTDLKEPGVGYNVIKYNPVGSADFVNPNLDVAYLEAWIAADDKTAVLLDVPEIHNRYYTAQILDEWGEVITNINERTFPAHAHGTFAFVTPGSTAPVPGDAVRIELHSHKAKMLARVELKNDRDGAIALQKQFSLTPMGSPAVQPTVQLPAFDNAALLGVELFDHVDAILASAPDVSPVAASMQAAARDIGQRARDPRQRKSLDAVIQERVVPQFLEFAVTKSGVLKNNWVATLGTGHYGTNYWRRSSANLVGLWANVNDEVIYFITTRDADGQPLNGANDYVLEFAAADRPDAVVDAYWSVILVDVPNYRVVHNPLNRFNFNNHSGLTHDADGSLRILFSRRPIASLPQSNWLPAPDGSGFSLTLRTYVPRDIVKRGEWFPPPLRRVS